MSDPYKLAPDSVPSEVPEGFVVRGSEEELIDAMASDLYVHAHNCVRTFGDFHLALSGGRSPQGLYRRLMYDPMLRDLPWKRTHLWVVAEPEDRDSAWADIGPFLAEHSDIPDAQIHPMPRGEGAQGAATYERELKESLLWRERGHDRLDYVLLGVDPGGGIGAYGVEDLTDDGDGLPVRVTSRGLTLGLSMINASRFVALLVVGPEKRAVLKQNGTKRPVDAVRPLAGEMRVYADVAAYGGADHTQ